MSGHSVGIVTGAARGMGYACAERLTSMVDTLILVDLDKQALAAACAALDATPTHVEPFVADITDEGALDRLVTRASDLGSLRAVAHAAGISPTMADWRAILTVDLVGTARFVRALRPAIKSGTAMVCFASMAAALLFPTGNPAGDAVVDDPTADDLPGRLHSALGGPVEDPALAYGWAKRGVQRLVQRESVRWGPLGGRICSVSPGMIDTPMGREELQQQPGMADLLKMTPVGRLGHPANVAALVAFLLSSDAGFITGCDILIDGGVCAAVSTAALPSS